MKKVSVGKTIWGCILPLIIFIGVDTVISAIAMCIYAAIETFSMGQIDDFYTAYMEVMNNSINWYYKYALYFTALRCLVIIPIYFLMMRKEKKRELADNTYVHYEKINKAWFLVIIPLGIVACIGFNNLVMMIAELAQSFINYIIDSFSLNIEYDIFATFNETSNIIYSGGIVMQILATCVGAPLAEELLFRGLLYGRLRKILKVVPAMLISSLMFGIIHGNIIQGIYATLIGLICAYVYEKFKSIWAPIILHAAANSFAVVSTNLVEESDGIGLGLGGYVLYTVILIAGTFLLMLLIEKKVVRKELPKPQVEVENFDNNQGEV